MLRPLRWSYVKQGAPRYPGSPTRESFAEAGASERKKAGSANIVDEVRPVEQRQLDQQDRTGSDWVKRTSTY